jgi:hypothetical protein
MGNLNLWKTLFEVLELFVEMVVLSVRDLGLIEHIVEPTVSTHLVDEPTVALARLLRGFGHFEPSGGAS